LKVLEEGGRASAAEGSRVEVVHFIRVKQRPDSGIKAMMAMAGVRMYKVDHLSFVGPTMLAAVVRKGYGATSVQLLTDRLKLVHSPNYR
jgi:hypothetical protein